MFQTVEYCHDTEAKGVCQVYNMEDCPNQKHNDRVLTQQYGTIVYRTRHHEDFANNIPTLCKKQE